MSVTKIKKKSGKRLGTLQWQTCHLGFIMLYIEKPVGTEIPSGQIRETIQYVKV